MMSNICSIKIGVLIPSYRRPRVLSISLPSWLRGEGVRYLVIAADSPFDHELDLYKQILTEIGHSVSNVKIIYDLCKYRRGSINARNKLLEIASNLNIDFAVMADDDHILPNPSFTRIMALHLKNDKSVGAVGGRVIMLRRRAVDPEFFLNLPMNVADPLTKVTGYVFLDVINGPRYAEFLTSFYMLRRDLLEHIRYDRLFESPTAYREESDVHMQIKKLGYKLVLDPAVYVLHLGLEVGGNRPSMSMAQRMYWKARNHTLFVYKHFKSLSRRLWYLFSLMVILSIYRPWWLRQIINGVKDGLYTFYADTMGSAGVRNMPDIG